MRREVTASTRGTTDGTGALTLSIPGPIRVTDRWELRTLTVTSERVGDGSYPTAEVYRSIVSPSYLIGTSRAADRVTFAAEGDWLLAGDSLLILIENTAPGTVATAALSAIEDRP